MKARPPFFPLRFHLLLLFLVFVTLPGAAVAQDDPDDQPDDGGVTGGYDPAVGLYVSDPAAGFDLSLGAYGQFRYSLNWREGQPDTVETRTRLYAMPRAEIFLTGSYTDRLDFQLRMLIEDASKFSLFVGYMTYNFSEQWNLTVGKQFIPLSREDWQYAQDLMAVDFSANDNTFAVGTSTGLMLHSALSERVRFWAGVSDGAFSAKREFPETEPAAALLNGRLELQVAGTDWSVWSDLIGRRGRSFGVLLGIAPAYLLRSGDDVQYRNESQVDADVSINGNGYQVLVSGTWTTRKPLVAERESSFGVYAQGGYFVNDTWQVYGRYDFVAAGDVPSAGPEDLEDFTSISAGVNFLPFRTTNRWKISAEVGYLFSAINNTIVSPSSSLGWFPSDTPGQTLLRLQAQFGF